MFIHRTGRYIHAVRNDRIQWKSAVAFGAVLAVMAGLVVAALLSVQYHWAWSGVWERRGIYLAGWLRTLGIAAVALPLSCAIGLVFALVRQSRLPLLAHAVRAYVEVTRGAPLLVQIYLYFYVFGTALRMENRYIVGTLILAVFAAAYISEIIRSGIESIGRSQLESARAIGLTTPQTYRHVIFPQAIRQMMPGLAGQFVSLVKDSSLLSVIAIGEFTLAGSTVAALATAPFEAYLPLAIGYLIITLPISLWTQRLERRLRYET
jgi:polar amino acid transport system permease protein